MFETLQDVVVTLVAAGAAWVVVRHVFLIAMPAGKPGCASCPSARAAAAPLAAQPRPLTVVRSR